MSDRPTPETDARTYVPSLGASTVPAEFARKLERERNEAQKELSSIHQWIERNHPDGFIDSQTYFQNLERFVDNWYDRLDRLEVDAKRFVRERDEAREAFVIATDQMVQAQCKTREALRERDEARGEFNKASVEANALATSIQKAEYSDAKEFELLGSVAGVISQIDNMYAGVRQQRDEAREALDCLLAVIGLTPIAGNKKALQEAVDQCLVVLRKQEETK
jgi:hypothetical protein